MDQPAAGETIDILRTDDGIMLHLAYDNDDCDPAGDGSRVINIDETSLSYSGSEVPSNIDPKRYRVELRKNQQSAVRAQHVEDQLMLHFSELTPGELVNEFDKLLPQEKQWLLQHPKTEHWRDMQRRISDVKNVNDGATERARRFLNRQKELDEQHSRTISISDIAGLQSASGSPDWERNIVNVGHQLLADVLEDMFFKICMHFSRRVRSSWQSLNMALIKALSVSGEGNTRFWKMSGREYLLRGAVVDLENSIGHLGEQQRAHAQEHIEALHAADVILDESLNIGTEEAAGSNIKLARQLEGVGGSKTALRMMQSRCSEYIHTSQPILRIGELGTSLDAMRCIDPNSQSVQVKSIPAVDDILRLNSPPDYLSTNDSTATRVECGFSIDVHTDPLVPTAYIESEYWRGVSIHSLENSPLLCNPQLGTVSVVRMFTQTAQELTTLVCGTSSGRIAVWLVPWSGGLPISFVGESAKHKKAADRKAAVLDIKTGSMASNSFVSITEAGYIQVWHLNSAVSSEVKGGLTAKSKRGFWFMTRAKKLQGLVSLFEISATDLFGAFPAATDGTTKRSSSQHNQGAVRRRFGGLFSGTSDENLIDFPSHVCFHPSITIAGRNPSVMVGTVSGEIVKYNADYFKIAMDAPIVYPCPPFVTKEYIHPHHAPNGFVLTTSVTEKKGNKVFRELFHFHRSRIILIDVVHRLSDSIVSIDQSGVLALWRYQDKFFEGKCWFRPYFTAQLALHVQREFIPTGMYHRELPANSGIAAQLPCIGVSVTDEGCLIRKYAPFYNEELGVWLQYCTKEVKGTVVSERLSGDNNKVDETNTVEEAKSEVQLSIKKDSRNESELNDVFTSRTISNALPQQVCSMTHSQSNDHSGREGDTSIGRINGASRCSSRQTISAAEPMRSDAPQMRTRTPPLDIQKEAIIDGSLDSKADYSPAILLKQESRQTISDAMPQKFYDEHSARHSRNQSAAMPTMSMSEQSLAEHPHLVAGLLKHESRQSISDAIPQQSVVLRSDDNEIREISSRQSISGAEPMMRAHEQQDPNREYVVGIRFNEKEEKRRRRKEHEERKELRRQRREKRQQRKSGDSASGRTESIRAVDLKDMQKVKAVLEHEQRKEAEKKANNESKNSDESPKAWNKNMDKSFGNSDESISDSSTDEYYRLHWVNGEFVSRNTRLGENDLEAGDEQRSTTPHIVIGSARFLQPLKDDDDDRNRKGNGCGLDAEDGYIWSEGELVLEVKDLHFTIEAVRCSHDGAELIMVMSAPADEAIRESLERRSCMQSPVMDSYTRSSAQRAVGTVWYIAPFLIEQRRFHRPFPKLFLAPHDTVLDFSIGPLALETLSRTVFILTRRGGLRAFSLLSGQEIINTTFPYRPNIKSFSANRVAVCPSQRALTLSAEDDSRVAVCILQHKDDGIECNCDDSEFFIPEYRRYHNEKVAGIFQCTHPHGHENFDPVKRIAVKTVLNIVVQTGHLQRVSEVRSTMESIVEDILHQAMNEIDSLIKSRHRKRRTMELFGKPPDLGVVSPTAWPLQAARDASSGPEQKKIPAAVDDDLMF